MRASALNPKVSIIYLTKNGGELLNDSLKSVFSQDIEFSYEVIAVDSGSTDGTLEVLASYPVKLFEVEPEDFNFGLTRDYSFSLAQGEILVAISQDAVPVDRDWLRNLVAPFSDESVSVVQGVDIPACDRELFYWDKIGSFYFTRECLRWGQQYGGIGVSFTCCAIRRLVWEQNKLGRISMSEDKVFQKRIVEKGHKIVMVENARDYHSHMYSLSSLSKRCENEGLGWRIAGQCYSAVDMLSDIFNYTIIKKLLCGIINRQIRTPAELFFPALRPFFVYKGNSFTKDYVR